MWTNWHNLEACITQLPYFSQLLCLKSVVKHPGLCSYEAPLVNHQSGSRRLWFNASFNPETQNHCSHFPESFSNHLTVECSQEHAQEMVHIAKHKREHDSSAQGWELSLGGRLQGSGWHPGKGVISLTRAMTGNQDSLPEDDSLNSKPAEAWSPLCFLSPFKEKHNPFYTTAPPLPSRPSYCLTPRVPFQALWKALANSKEWRHPTSILITNLMTKAPWHLLLDVH